MLILSFCKELKKMKDINKSKAFLNSYKRQFNN